VTEGGRKEFRFIGRATYRLLLGAQSPSPYGRMQQELSIHSRALAGLPDDWAQGL